MSLKNFTKGSCIMLGILLFMCLAFSVPDAYSISTISGTVRDQSSNPIVGIQVGAFDAATCPANFVNGAVTGPGGVYTIPVPAGTYKVAAQGNQTYSPQFYNQAFDCNTATSVPLSDGQTNDTVNFFLLPAPPNQGTISGTVMDESLNPISGVTVVIFDYSTGNPVGLGVATPSYSIYVPAGTYRVGALGNAQYSAEFYSNAPDFGSAWQVGVTSGQPTTNIDFSLASVPQTGSISGYVYDESGTTPIEGINVSANNYDGGGGGGSAVSDSSGLYTIANLQPGDYRVYAQGNGTYVGEFYNDTYNWNNAERVSVADGQTSYAFFYLAQGGTISGTVTDGTNPLSGIMVFVNDSNWNNVGNDTTDQDGSYSITVPVGTGYRVTAQGTCTLATQMQSDIEVTVSGTTVDFILPPGGCISGTVRDAGTSQGLGNMGVSVHDTSGDGEWVWLGGTMTNESGTYLLQGVPVGTTWMVLADDQNQPAVYVQQYYDHQSSEDAYTPVTVNQGETTINIDFDLSKGGSITGYVEDESEEPVVGVWVEAVTVSGEHLGGTQTDINGNYLLTGVIPGDVFVRCNTTDSGYMLVSQYYSTAGGTIFQNEASPVTVIAEQVTEFIDFTLAEGAYITGTISTDGLPAQEGWVTLYSVTLGRWLFDSAVEGRTIDTEGTWEVVVPAGTYKLVAGASPENEYPMQYFDSTYFFTEAAEGAVLPGEWVGGIDFYLTSDGGAISGTTSYEGQVQQPGTVIVWISPNSGNDWPEISGGTGGPIGPYTLTVPAGTWYVKAFMDVNENRMYDSGEPFGEYDGGSVIITTGASPSGIDIILSDAVTPTSPSQVCIYYNGAWYLDMNSNGAWDGTPTDSFYGDFGIAGAIPVTGDWDGTGTTRVGIYYNGAWYLDMDGNGSWDGTPTDRFYGDFGIAGAIPVTGDWDGTGTTRVGIYYNGTWYLDLNANGVWDGTPTDNFYGDFGIAGAVPVTGDWDGTSTTRIGIYYNGAWYLDMDGNGSWDGAPTDAFYGDFGIAGAVPITGDWDGTGTTRIGIYYTGTWYLDMDGNGSWDGTPTDAFYGDFGIAGAVPVTGKW